MYMHSHTEIFELDTQLSPADSEIITELQNGGGWKGPLGII